MSNGLNHSPETLELLGVLRARRSNVFNFHNLQSGATLLGDYRRYGLTEQKYRSATKRLGQWGFADFKPTTRGTVATLLNTRIYDINETASQRTNNEPATDNQRTANE